MKKVQFIRDYKDHKSGDLVDLPEAEADDLHQGGIACPYVAPKLQPKQKEADSPKAAKKKGQ